MAQLVWPYQCVLALHFGLIAADRVFCAGGQAKW